MYSHLPKLIGPRVKEATAIRTCILRFLQHAMDMPVPEIRKRVNRTVQFVEKQTDTNWFLNYRTLTRDSHSALGAITVIAKDNSLF